jgi:hypothetical protein
MLKTRESNSSPRLSAKHTQAARPLAGGSPSAPRVEVQELLSWLFPVALWVAGRIVVPLKALGAPVSSHFPRSTEHP